MALDHILKDEEQVAVQAVEGVADALAVHEDINRDRVVRGPVLHAADIMEPCSGIENEPLGSREFNPPFFRKGIDHPDDTD